MKRLSLTARLSLMFMLAVTGALGVAGAFFYQLSLHHFDELDRGTLDDKLQATRQLLRGVEDMAQFDALRPQLDALLGGHRDLAVRVVDSGGRILFAVEAAAPEAHLYGSAADQSRPDERAWRRRAVVVDVAGQPVSIELALDVTTHRLFFYTLTGWFWGALVLSALLSAGLGWLLVRSGLRPLREVTQMAASVSAKSLTERIPAESTPAELQQLMLAFNAMLARLEEAFVRLSNFSSDIAHELRTPLSNLMTHTEVVLSRARNSESYQDNLHSNLEELRRLSRMIDDMLFLAKADNGLIVPAAQPIELHVLCEKLLEFYGLTAEERGVRIELTGAARIEGDPAMLHRALSNLLSNALRYTPDGEVIRVGIATAAEGVLLTVANPGTTIAEEHLPRLFDRFYRVDPARREGNPSNAGLGLAITRSIVEAHRAEIICRSRAGWTSFEILFRPAGQGQS